MDSFDVWVWNKLFKASIIKDNGLRSPDEIRYADDRVFLNDYIMYCSKVVYMSKALYHYVENESSAMHATVVNGKFNYALLDNFKANKIIYDTIEPLRDKAVMNAFKGFMFIVNRSLAYFFLPFYDGSDKKTLRLLRRNLVKYFPYYLRCPRLFKGVGKKNALKVLVYIYFPSLYKLYKRK